MKKSIVLIVVCASVLFLVSCRGSNNSSSDVGSLTFGLELKGAPESKSKILMAPIDCIASGIATIEASVYDQNNAFLLSGGPWACNLHTGTITGIQAGTNRKIIINTRDASGNILYSGEKTGLTITAGQTNNAGEVILAPFIYWSINTIDSADDAGRDSALALDSNKKVHIAYYDGTNQDLKYITNASGAWVVRTIDSTGNMGSYPSIAVDSYDKIHISYYDATNGDLKYATNTSGTWFIVTVESTGDVGQYSDIAVDANGKARISYYDNTNQDLRYATEETGLWVSSLVESSGDVGKFSAIAIGPTGTVHISCLDATNMDLRYATSAGGGGWTTTPLDQTGNVGEYSDIAVDANDKVHISYFDANNEALKYSTNSSGNWVNTTVDMQSYEPISSNAYTWHYVGYRTSIAVDANGKAHISYHERLHDRYGASSPQNYRWRLKYATNASGTWIAYGLDSISASDWTAPPSVGDTAIAVDSGSKVHIGYYHMTSGDLKYATSASSSWSTNTIDMAANVGQYNSLAADSTGKAYIAFYDITNGNLKYMTNAAGAWTGSTIDSAGDAGKFASIAIDANKKAHVSYYDTTRAALKYATNSLASWTTTTIDSSANVGEFSSLALDSSGKAHVSYIDETNKNLKYATNATGAWITAIVDSAGNVGYHTDIALNSTGKAYISYSDESGNLKYATNVSGTWVYTVVDTSSTTSGVQYQYTSIRADSSNTAHISYYDVVNGDLKYATNASGSWVAAAIDSVGDVGKFTSLALDGTGKVHISYYDATNGDLRYATNQSGAWLVYTLDSGGDVGQYSSLAIDTLGNRHISYYNATNSDLKYATTAAAGAGQLSDQTAPSAPTGITATPASATGITIGWAPAADNNAVTGYQVYRDGIMIASSVTGTHYSDSGLPAYAQYCYTVAAYDASNNVSQSSLPACAVTYLFNSETIAAGSAYSLYTSLALDHTDTPHLGYFESVDGGVLLYATKSLGSWATYTALDPANSSAGQRNAIAAGASGVSLLNEVSRWETVPNNHWEHDLVHLSGSVGSWTSTITDTTTPTDFNYPSIAMDGSGKSHAAYSVHDGSKWLMKYATDASGSWSNTVIDSGLYTSIEADASNRAHVAYVNTAGALRYAVISNIASWTTGTAAIPGGYYAYPSLALDSGGNAHIAVYDGTWRDNNYHVVYVSNASGSWAAMDIDIGGMAPSIAVDSSGNVHITYRGEGGMGTKYATNASGSFVTYDIANCTTNTDASVVVDSMDKPHVLCPSSSLLYLSKP